MCKNGFFQVSLDADIFGKFYIIFLALQVVVKMSKIQV